MNDSPSSAAQQAAAATPPEGGLPVTDALEPTGDPELAALVSGGAAGPRPEATPEGDPELASLVAPRARAVASGSATAVPVAAGDAPEPALASAEPDVAATAVVAAAEPDPVAADAEAVSAADQAATIGVLTEPIPAHDPQASAVERIPLEAPAQAEDPAASGAEFPIAAVVTATPPDEPQHRKPHRGRPLIVRFAFAFVFGAALVVALGAGALYAWGLQYDGRVLPGVHLGHLDLSGLTPGEATAKIQSAYASFGNGEVVLTAPAGNTTIPFADIGRGPDVTGLLASALAAGRQGEPLADLIGGPQAALHGVTINPAITYDRTKLTAIVDRLANGIDKAAVNAAVGVAPDGSYSVTASEDGKAVDRAGLLAALDRQLTSLDAPAKITLDVPVATVVPTTQSSSADAAKAAADRMVADLVIARGTDTWTIPSASLRALVSFAVAQDGTISPTFDASGLEPLVAALAKQVNQTPQDATLKLVGKHVVAGGKSREGRTLDVAGMTAAIVSQIAARQAGTAVEPLPAVVKAVQPKLSSADATAMAGQMRAIGSYSIYYWVLVNNYWGGNIEAPAKKISGTVIPAGGTFDFWKVVGDLHKIPGVGPGNAIEGGKITVTGAFGGGICTTSTTLFNAALRAGMTPGARQNHNEFIDRYPAGLDATVWIVGNAKQTMSFTNDTPYPIVIQAITQSTGSKRWLTFKIWSVPNGRTTVIGNPIIQPTRTAIDTVEKDPTHPVGWSYRVNTPVNGYKVWRTVTIYDHGKVHFKITYFSNYPPVNGVLQVGTKPVG